MVDKRLKWNQITCPECGATNEIYVYDLFGEIYPDYIDNPKVDGYRGYHLIGAFPDKDGDRRLIEIQVRTSIQHDWATALEIVDLFTGQALKSNQGKKWKK